MSEIRSTRSHIHSYDGIRALAALAVFLYHLIPVQVPHGYLAVVIFFVLAGFLCTRSVLLQPPVRPIRIGTVPGVAGRSLGLAARNVNRAGPGLRDSFGWLKRRVGRLWPPMLLMMLAVTVLMLVLPPFKAFLPRFGSAVISGLFGISNTVQTISGESYFEGQGYLKPLTHLWALSLEWQFYVLFAFTVRRAYRAGRRKDWALVYGIGALLSAAFFYVLLSAKGMNPAYYSLAARLHAFLLGGLGAFWATKRTQVNSRPVRILRDASSVLLTLGLLLGFVLRYPLELGIAAGIPLYGLLAVLLLLLLHSDDGLLAAVSRVQPLAWLASRSFELYLWHYPVFRMLNFALAGYKIDYRLIYLIQAGISLLLTELSWQLLHRFRSWAAEGPRVRQKGPALLAVLLSLLLLAGSVGILASSRGPSEMDQLQESIEAQEARLAAEASRRAEEAARTTARTKEDESTPAETTAGTTLETTTTAVTTAATTTAATTATTTETEPVQPVEADLEALLADPPESEAYAYMKEWFHLGGDYLVRQDDYMAIRDLPVTVVGDSLAVSLSYAIETFLPAAEVYAKSNRQMHEAPALLAELAQSGLLSDTILLVLGSNGEIEPADLDAVRQVTGDRQLILATIVLPYADSEARRNQAVRDYIDLHPDIGLVDWFFDGKGRDGIFLSDQIHLTIPGNRAYIQLICSELVRLRNQQPFS